MKIYHSNEKIEYLNPAVALGNFDGLHTAHQKIIKACKNVGDTVGVMLFDCNTNSKFKKDFKILTSTKEKIEILESLGVDFVYVVNFDDEFMNKLSEEFAKFLSSIGVFGVSVGYDFRCGAGAKSDATEFSKELSKFGIKTQITESVTNSGEEVKSSLIREYVKSGNIKRANELMGRCYTLSGAVAHGERLGHKLGFPTANVNVENEKLLPGDSVYFGYCKIGKDRKKAVINIGKNPTFSAETRTVEVHIIDFYGDLYGENITVEFVEKIRDEIKFENACALSAQLKKDKEYAISKG